MVINLTSKTILVKAARENTWGYYDVPYPSDQVLVFDAPIDAIVTDRTHDSLTLVKLNALDFNYKNRLVWVDLTTTEV
jgi:hypothetical protein